MTDDETEDDARRAERARKGSPFLNTAQTAHYLRISLRTLEKLSATGDGPPFRRHGNQKAFHIADIEEWSRQHKRSTSRRRQSRETP